MYLWWAYWSVKEPNWDRSTLIGVKKWDFANYSEFENEDETLEIANSE